jgi:uncharacterized RDD family membrane protein YckC
VPYAGLVSRLLAFFVDLLIIALLIAGTVWIAHQLSRPILGTAYLDATQCSQLNEGWRKTHLCQILPLVGLIALFGIPPLYRIGFWTIAGRTPGMAIFGLRLRRTDGRAVGFGTSLVRFACYLFPLVTGFVGFLLVLVTKRRQGLHDLLARTVVIYDPPPAA